MTTILTTAISCLVLVTPFPFPGYDDYLDEDDLDLIEENLGVKVKRRVRISLKSPL